jgi:hypothetical protein
MPFAVLQTFRHRLWKLITMQATGDTVRVVQISHSAAGELHTGPAGDLSLYELESPYIAENANLRRHLAYLIEEMDRRGDESAPSTSRQSREGAVATGAPARLLSLATADSGSTGAADTAGIALSTPVQGGAEQRGALPPTAEVRPDGQLRLAQAAHTSTYTPSPEPHQSRHGSGSGLQPIDITPLRGQESAFESSTGRSQYSAALDSPLSAPVRLTVSRSVWL